MGYVPNEEFVIVLKDLLKQMTELIRLQNKQAEFYEGFMKKGLIFEKRCNKFAKVSQIYLPQRLAGKTFKVILIPTAETTCYTNFDIPKRSSKNRGNPNFPPKRPEPIEPAKTDRRPLI